MRRELPVVPLCTGCARCCDTIGLPPFEVPNPDLGAVPVESAGRHWCQTEQHLRDMDTFAAMPAELRAEHARLVTELDGNPFGRPCVWLDTETKSCRHYDHRPAVCRDFEPGEPRCVSLREKSHLRITWRGDIRPDDWWNPRHGDPDPPAVTYPWDRESPGWMKWLAGLFSRHSWRRRLGLLDGPAGALP